MISEYNLIYWLTKHFVTDEPPEMVERIGAFSRIEYAKKFCEATDQTDLCWITALGNAWITDVIDTEDNSHWYKITKVVVP